MKSQRGKNKKTCENEKQKKERKEQQQAFAQKEQNVAVERVKFWVGLPNKYYSDAEDWRDT